MPSPAPINVPFSIEFVFDSSAVSHDPQLQFDAIPLVISVNGVQNIVNGTISLPLLMEPSKNVGILFPYQKEVECSEATQSKVLQFLKSRLRIQPEDSNEVFFTVLGANMQVKIVFLPADAKATIYSQEEELLRVIYANFFDNSE